jgi:hypothetical protein
MGTDHDVVLIVGPSLVLSSVSSSSFNAVTSADELGSSGASAGTGSFQKLVGAKNRKGPASTGGFSTGGASTGGVSTGVVVTGGSSAGGIVTGGASTGGASTDTTGSTDAWSPAATGGSPSGVESASVDGLRLAPCFAGLGLDFFAAQDCLALRCLRWRTPAATHAGREEDEGFFPAARPEAWWDTALRARAGSAASEGLAMSARQIIAPMNRRPSRSAGSR